MLIENINKCGRFRVYKISNLKAQARNITGEKPDQIYPQESLQNEEEKQPSNSSVLDFSDAHHQIQNLHFHLSGVSKDL